MTNAPQLAINHFCCSLHCNNGSVDARVVPGSLLFLGQVMSESVWCHGCGEYKGYDDESGLCWRCHKDAERQLAAEAEERRQEFLLSQHDAAAEDIGYGKVQQARAEREWK
jgi:hypothetical protein